jgi:hypothetical protein
VRFHIGSGGRLEIPSFVSFNHFPHRSRLIQKDLHSSSRKSACSIGAAMAGDDRRSAFRDNELRRLNACPASEGNAFV